MKKPKVVLKNIVTFRGIEGIGVNADVYINDVKCMFMIDAADGSPYDYDIYDMVSTKVQKNIKLLEEYIKTLPPHEYKLNGKQVLIEMDMDMFLNEIIIKQEQEKERRKIERMYKNYIIFGIEGADKYKRMKLPKPVAECPPVYLQSIVRTIKTKHCTNGETIWNTNLKALGVSI